jgi:tetratricopeptide (TPR) repeat protein
LRKRAHHEIEGFSATSIGCLCRYHELGNRQSLWHFEKRKIAGPYLQEALEQIHQAQQLDPLSPIIQSIEALNLNYARDYDGAIAQCKRVISRDLSFGEIYAYLGFAYEQKGMFNEALDAYQTYSTLVGNNSPAATVVRSSRVAGAGDYWGKMIALSKLPGGSLLSAAQAFARLGEPDKALSLLEQAYARHSYGILYLKVQPNLDPLRSDPRFKDLLQRVALAE